MAGWLCSPENGERFAQSHVLPGFWFWGKTDWPELSKGRGTVMEGFGGFAGLLEPRGAQRSTHRRLHSNKGVLQSCPLKELATDISGTSSSDFYGVLLVKGNLWFCFMWIWTIS